MKVLQRVSDTVNRIVGYVGIAVFLALIIACVMQVFFRFVLNNSLSWTEELARYCFIWMHMLGASILGGVGFTMAIFVANLAYTADALIVEAKLAILLASLVAGVVGFLFLFLQASKECEED